MFSLGCRTHAGILSGLFALLGVALLVAGGHHDAIGMLLLCLRDCGSRGADDERVPRRETEAVLHLPSPSDQLRAKLNGLPERRSSKLSTKTLSLMERVSRWIASALRFQGTRPASEIALHGGVVAPLFFHLLLEKLADEL